MRILRVIFPIIVAVLFFYLFTFKVGNADFWWHIKAGKLLRHGGWIVTDPFAYTRAGEAYLANHEWLAQIVFSLLHDLTGYTGIIMLRMVIVCVIFGLPLLLDRRNLWINTGLSLLAAIAARPAIIDRPHLFTILMFSIVMYIVLAYIEDKKIDQKKYTVMVLPLLIVLWSNLHGAAGVIGIAVFGTLGIQRLADRAERKEMLVLVLVGVLSCLALLLTPSGFDNIRYMWVLMGDKTTDLIAEWQSVPLGEYLKHVGIFWVIVLAACFKGRRHLLCSTLILLGIGYLSKSAVRHEVLFIVAALALTIHQLKHSEFHMRKIFLIAALFILTTATLLQAYSYNMHNNLFGFGEFTPLKGASEFIHSSGITGNMFNNYNAGGELIFRGHKVFLDGRNLDYGYDYISRAIEAGLDVQKWNELSTEYDFTHAIIYYSLETGKNPIPYIDILQNDPHWGLQYLDDWSAVYVKNEEDRMTQITPKMLHNSQMPEEISLGNLQILQSEVQNIIDACPECAKAPEYKQEMVRAFST
ncbi:hypothetical protein COU75_00035 [Candidatus Peregrinibacteria bacterium CG10_big_fil_rev_8_21_14_0_10_42_8]|nr:MAG: hypothetical protein COU75_00035 [Candidatus Peregrinibacteria bacterium CG10_big_fil_rev_8_21_14_0_10_42_8]